VTERRQVATQVNALNLFDRRYVSTLGTNGFTTNTDYQTLLTGALRELFVTLATTFWPARSERRAPASPPPCRTLLARRAYPPSPRQIAPGNRDAAMRRSFRWRRVRMGARVVLIVGALAACGTHRDGGAGDGVPVLLYTGAGTSRGDVAAVEAILRRDHLRYATSSASALNAMSASQLRGYRLLIVPGGDFEKIGNGLTKRTTAQLRAAIGDGVSYLGICAGAFFAGDSPYNGLNLTSGARFGFYAAEAQGVRKTAVTITSAGGQRLDHYWEDGPQLSGWGAVVGRYPDGTPAIVEGRFGDGWVILTGVHAEAPASWRRGMDFGTSVDSANAYAATLVRAALNRATLPHY
jgi:glutamine amidotransferase-like uncharacterized protein